MAARSHLLWLLALGGVACAHRPAPPPPPTTPRLEVAEIARLVPATVADREGWALDVLTALDAHRLWPDLAAVCSVLAVVEQESGYQANPAVPGLSKIVHARLDAYAAKYPVVGRAAIDALLDARAPGTRQTFAQRLEAARTERDLDLVFRDMLRHYETDFPTTYKLVDLGALLAGRGGLEGLNPITTAGSMQVSVRFSIETSASEKLEPWQIRDRLYTRAGGVYYGAWRLLGYTAGYDQPIYRFADYNAGFYSSRNAAFQEQLGELVGQKLLLDGDLLAYDPDGSPSGRDSSTLAAMLAFARQVPGLSEGEVRKDARTEKLLDFESTRSWRAVKDAWARRFGRAPAYARLPEVEVHSPKMKKARSTAWFAQSVDQRYRACLERAR